MTRRKFEVFDRERLLTFTGVLLGSASSRQPDSDRWTDVSVYKTDAGAYVVSSIGQTSVHAGDIVWDDATQMYVTSDVDEEPRYRGHVCDTAQGAITALYKTDGNGLRYLTNVAKRALSEAGETDEAIRNALMIEEVA